MKVAVVSDTHLGFGWNTERKEDSFRNFKEALEKVKDADVVLLPGDIFDTKNPKLEVLSRTLRIMREESGESNVSVKNFAWEDGRTPFIAIHGTHERRGKNSVNPVELLDDAGMVIHLHNDSVTVEKNGEVLNIFGMSGVPERYGAKVLNRWSPEPRKGSNILMFHQSVRDFVYTDSEMDVVELSDFPKGFDYIVDGHIHWRNLSLRGKEVPLVFPGSTIATQLTKKDSEVKKGVLWIDTVEEEISFETLDSPRKVFHREVDVTDMTGKEVEEKAVSEAEKASEGEGRKPLVRLVLTGETDATFSKRDIKSSVDNAFLKLGDKTVESSKDDESKIEIGEEEVEEVGVSMLSEEVGFEGFEEVFEDLSKGNVDRLFDRFSGMDLDEVEEFIADVGETEEEKVSDESKNEDVGGGSENLLDHIGGSNDK